VYQNARCNNKNVVLILIYNITYRTKTPAIILRRAQGVEIFFKSPCMMYFSFICGSFNNFFSFAICISSNARMIHSNIEVSLYDIEWGHGTD
jgi:hypothetical protein